MPDMANLTGEMLQTPVRRARSVDELFKPLMWPDLFGPPPGQSVSTTSAPNARPEGLTETPRRSLLTGLAPSVTSATISRFLGPLLGGEPPPPDAGPAPTGAAMRSGFGISTGMASYGELADSISQESGVDQRLVRAIIAQESGWNPRAVSPAGAKGLMQLMDGTAQRLGVQDPFDPEQNIRGGVAFLKWLLEKYGGDETLALAAYNAGPGAVDQYGGVPPYEETQRYVAAIRRLMGTE